MSDRESKACPLCKSRAERIVGLKAEAARWRDRYADAMAKLARVADPLEALDMIIENMIEQCAGEMLGDALDARQQLEFVNAIPSDTSKPLAVVDGWYAPGDDFPVRISDYGVDNEVPVTVIIMPKEATDGD
jgi:hypothetical protein